MHRRLDPSLSLDAALTTWKTLKGVGKRPRTLEFHKYLTDRIRKHWPEAVAKPIGEITETEVAEFATRAQRFSPDQFNAVVYVVKSVVPAAWFLKRKVARPKRVWLPTPHDYNRLLRELDNAHIGHAGLVVRFLVMTGLRIGEARSLLWSDVVKKSVYVPDSKTGEPRRVPFNDEVAEVLSQLRRVAGDSKHIINVKTVRRALEGAAKRAGLPRMTHHALRKLFATRCIESRVPVPIVSHWMGHKDGGALLGKTYFHLLEDHSAAMMNEVRFSA